MCHILIISSTIETLRARGKLSICYTEILHSMMFAAVYDFCVFLRWNKGTWEHLWGNGYHILLEKRRRMKASQNMQKLKNELTSSFFIQKLSTPKLSCIQEECMCVRASTFFFHFCWLNFWRYLGGKKLSIFKNFFFQWSFGLEMAQNVIFFQKNIEGQGGVQNFFCFH